MKIPLLKKRFKGHAWTEKSNYIKGEISAPSNIFYYFNVPAGSVWFSFGTSEKGTLAGKTAAAAHQFYLS